MIQYNNVTWKGCTLRVEKAKLPFLQRLQVERDEMKRAKKEEQDKKEPLVAATPAASAANAITDTKDRKVNRHLRIKKRFGEEVYVVDTKPIETKSQRDLIDILDRQRDKRQKQIELIRLNKKKKRSKTTPDAASIAASK